MIRLEASQDLLTPGEVAEYLQVNRDTVYRYIRDGKLSASRVGRGYRIARSTIDLWLWSTRTLAGVTPREYSAEDIDRFLAEDELGDATLSIAKRFIDSVDGKRADR